MSHSSLNSGPSSGVTLSFHFPASWRAKLEQWELVDIIGYLIPKSICDLGPQADVLYCVVFNRNVLEISMDFGGWRGASVEVIRVKGRCKCVQCGPVWVRLERVPLGSICKISSFQRQNILVEMGRNIASSSRITVLCSLLDHKAHRALTRYLIPSSANLWSRWVSVPTLIQHQTFGFFS